MNYELEFEQQLIELTNKNYGINKETEIYLIMRYIIINNYKYIRDINKNDFCKFILKQNNLPEELIYKDKIIYLYSKREESIYNIIDNWFFEIEKKNNIDYIEKRISYIYNQSIKNNTKLKNNKNYKYFLLRDNLKELNNLFEVKLDGYFKMPYLKYNNNHNVFERYEEEKLTSIIDCCEVSNEEIISEADLQKYIKYNLNKIEEGLTLLSVEYKINNAFIDILAKDKNNKIVIIELKIKDNDERLIWQVLYYPLEYKEESHVNDVRMLVIAPGYNYNILKVLDTIKDCELYTYKIDIKNKKINNICIKKVSN